jgi:sulfate adenylyltransferase subunit 2
MDSNRVYYVLVTIETFADRVHDAILSSPVGSTTLLYEHLDGEDAASRRHLNRILAAFFADTASSLDDVLDGDGRPLTRQVTLALMARYRGRPEKLIIGQILSTPGGEFLVASDGRGERWWVRLTGTLPEDVTNMLVLLKGAVGAEYALVPHSELHRLLSGISAPDGVTIVDYAHGPLPYVPPANDRRVPLPADQQHLKALEAESIRIIREAVAVAKRPGMLFSMGKDSMVMWTLAKKAFWPDPPPFPLVAIDTQWKFQDMYRFRHYMAERPDVDLRVHINPEAIKNNVNPFDFGSAVHTDITKTQALKQVLDNFQFDYVFGGARRDEEKSRAKERIFSLRDSKHGWDPKNQRPELWNLYNTRLLPGQSMRVFPLSNWTELDIWRYINAEGIELVPLYFSKVRPFVERDGSLIMVDDDRFPLAEGEKIHFEPIRFRTLGCYPLTGGVRSDATTVDDIIRELEQTRVSERSSRVIDFDPGASMEQKKKEGYF